MKAVILAAGFSTRLYPLTKTFPKALLTVRGRPILEQSLSQVLDLPEVDGISLVTNEIYFPHFSQFLEQFDKEKRISLVSDHTTAPENRLGAIADLLLVMRQKQLDDNLLVLASDTLTSMKLVDFVRYFRQVDSSITALFDLNDPERIRGKLGCASVNQENEIIAFVEKPQEPASSLVAVPYYLFHQRDLPLIREYPATGQSLDSPGSLLGYLHQKTNLHALVLPREGYYYDVGTRDALEAVQKDVRISHDELTRHSREIS